MLLFSLEVCRTPGSVMKHLQKVPGLMPSSPGGAAPGADSAGQRGEQALSLPALASPLNKPLFLATPLSLWPHMQPAFLSSSL